VRAEPRRIGKPNFNYDIQEQPFHVQRTIYQAVSTGQSLSIHPGIWSVYRARIWHVQDGVNNLNYNTLFLDEAINVVIGQDFLQGTFSRNALTFHFGSYLYPILSAVINKLAGVTALRLTSTILMCIASAFVYFTARKLFGRKAGLIGAMLFSFNGNILNLGQLAVYDSLAIPFLAISFYFLVAASTSGANPKRLLLIASIFATLATLSKYIGLIYLPALFLTALVLFWLKGTSLRKVVTTLSLYFVLPIVLALGLYAAFTWHELTLVFQEQGFSLAPRWLITKIIVREIGSILLLALAGLAMLVGAVALGRSQNTQALFGKEGSQVNWQTIPRTYLPVFILLLFVLVCAWLASPLQHWLTSNNRSLWKNCAYSLIFLTPLAGYCVSRTIEFLRSRSLIIVRVMGMLIICTGVYYFADRTLDSNSSFHQSWPNTEGVIGYLRNNGLNENSRILAEEMDVYQYYFEPALGSHQVWNSFWYMEYRGISGQEGALAAVRDRAVDFVIIDDYYIPGIRERLNPILLDAGYVVGWQEVQNLRSGDTILVQVFVPGDGESR